MREKLENLDFSSHRIGYIVKLLNRLYPMLVKRSSIERRYSDKDLVDYLTARGFTALKANNNLDIPTAINKVESRGYIVKGTEQLEKMSKTVGGANLLLKGLSRTNSLPELNALQVCAESDTFEWNFLDPNLHFFGAIILPVVR